MSRPHDPGAPFRLLPEGSRPLEDAVRWINDGHALVVFPAGAQRFLECRRAATKGRLA